MHSLDIIKNLLHKQKQIGINHLFQIESIRNDVVHGQRRKIFVEYMNDDSFHFIVFGSIRFLEVLSDKNKGTIVQSLSHSCDGRLCLHLN